MRARDVAQSRAEPRVCTGLCMQWPMLHRCATSCTAVLHARDTSMPCFSALLIPLVSVKLSRSGWYLANEKAAVSRMFARPMVNKSSWPKHVAAKNQTWSASQFRRTANRRVAIHWLPSAARAPAHRTTQLHHCTTPHGVHPLPRD